MYELFQLSTYAIKKASDIILKYYNSSYKVQMKGKGNPVTEADIEADEILKEILMKETPEFGWLSEETRDLISLPIISYTIRDVNPSLSTL